MFVENRWPGILDVVHAKLLSTTTCAILQITDQYRSSSGAKTERQPRASSSNTPETVDARDTCDVSQNLLYRDGGVGVKFWWRVFFPLTHTPPAAGVQIILISYHPRIFIFTYHASRHAKFEGNTSPRPADFAPSRPDFCGLSYDTTNMGNLSMPVRANNPTFFTFH